MPETWAARRYEEKSCSRWNATCSPKQRALIGNRLYNGNWPLDNDTIALFRNHQSEDLDCVIARFATEAAAKDYLGIDFLICSLSEQMERIHRCANSGRRFSIGPVFKVAIPARRRTWRTLLTASERIWKTTYIPDLGVYYFYMQSTSRSATNPSMSEEQFDHILTQVKEPCSTGFINRSSLNMRTLKSGFQLHVLLQSLLAPFQAMNIQYQRRRLRLSRTPSCFLISR